MPSKNFEVKTTYRAVDRTSRVLGKMQTKVAKFAARASRSMNRISRATSKVSGTLTAGLKIGAVATTGAVIGLAAAITKTAESMDLLAKQAREVNFPIEEFQEWRFVAEQSGIDSEKFSKGMLTFNKRLGKLKGGFGPLYTALKKTNPQLARQLKAAENSAQAMDIMVRAMQDAKGADMKSMLADAAFGLTKMSLVGMKSADAIAALRGEMRENGIVTGEQAAQAEAYNDMMNRLKLTITGLLVNVLTPLMPIIKEIADSIRMWAGENRELISSKFAEYLKWIVDNFSLIVEWGKKIGAGIAIFYGVVAAIKVLNAVMTVFNAIAAMNPIGLIVIAFIAAIALITVFRDEINAFMFKIFDAIAAVGKAIKTFFVGIWEWLKASLVSIRDFFVGVWEFLYSKFGMVFDAIAAYFIMWVDIVKNIFGFFIAVFTGDWDKAGEHLMGIWEAVKTFFVEVFGGILSYLSGWVDSVISFFSGMWDRILATVTPWIDTLKELFGAFVDFFTGDWESAGERFVRVWERIKNAAKSVIGWLLDKLGPVISAVRSVGSVFGFDGEGAEGGAGGGGRSLASPIRPTVNLSQSATESISREQTEVTLRDETGRAEVTKGGKGRGFKMVHSGAMP